ncbi:SdrD B-like domain-containing protein [Roseimaritima ulvae]|uniref:SdrD B-like domain-containing protein n=1 Tax=Roseimaritima ulvae TaxID=980254 RepID=UPI00082C59ED|nr:SdrD B-like domain-containing protein [Roseimaritima ulvae]
MIHKRPQRTRRHQPGQRSPLRNRSATRRRGLRGRIETLEARRLLAGDVGTSTIYVEDFEPDDGGYTADNTGGSILGFWHHSLGRSADNLPGHSPTHAFYYGQFETVLGGGRYPVFADHQGMLSSPDIELPCGTNTLSFNYLLGTRTPTDRDFVEVRILDVTTGTVDVLLSRAAGTLPETHEQWSSAAADLTAYSGRTIQLQFSFDTGVVEPIDPEGWYVDDVLITNTPCSANLAVSKSVDDATPNEGQRLSYTVTASSAADSDVTATDVQVVDTLPAGVSYVVNSASPPAVYDSIAHTLTWSGLQLDPGSAQPLTFQVDVNAGTAGDSLSNLATVTAPLPDPDLDDNQTIHMSTVNQVDLVTVKYASDAMPNEEQTLQFTVGVKNLDTSNADATDVTIVDTLPAGVSYVASSPPGVYDPGSHTVTWTVPSIAVDETAEFFIDTTVNTATAGLTFENIAVANGQETDPNPDNNTGKVPFTVNSVNLSVVKSVDDATPNEDQAMTFLIGVTNAADSNAAATDVKVVDTLPDGVTFTGASDGGVFDPILRTVTWTLPEIPIGGTVPLQIDITVDADTSGQTLENNVVVEGLETDPDKTNNADAEIFTVNSVDLLVDKAVDDATPNEGQAVAFTIDVTNAATSNATATGVTIVDTLPDGVTFAAASDGGVFDPILQTVTWTLPNIPIGGTVSLQIDVTVDAGITGQTLENEVVATGDETDPDQSNNTDTETFTVNRVDLLVDKVVDDATPNEDQAIAFTIDVTNAATSNATATGVTIVDTLPDGVTFTDASDGGVFDPNLRTVTWTLPVLPIGGTVSLQIDVTVDANASGQTLENLVVVGGDETDPDQSNNIDTEAFTVNSVDLSVVKTVDNPTPDIDDLLTYTITVTNSDSSNADATNVLVQDMLPAGLTLVSPQPAVWMIPVLPPGQSQTFELTATVDAGTCGQTMTNVLTVGADETDPDATNNAAIAPILVTCSPADLLVEKTVSDETPNEGQTLTFEIDVTDSADSNLAAETVTVVDTLPSGVFYVASTPPGVFDPIANTVTWTVPSIDIGQQVEFNVETTVNAGTAGASFENSVRVGGDEAFAAFTVNSVDLSVDKTVDDATPGEGQQVTFTMVVTNASSSNAVATEVALTDVLPSGLSYVSDDSGGDYDPVSGVWTIGELPIGESQTLQLVATVGVGTEGTSITNTAVVEADETDPDPDNNESPETLTIAQGVQFISPLSIFRPGPFVLPTTERIAVMGRVWHDQNDNGQWDAGEAGIDGVDVTLQGIGTAQTRSVDLNQDGTIDPVSERGLYWFQQLGQIPPGDYTLEVQLPTGQATSFPATTATHTITLDTANPSLISDALQTVAPNFGLSQNFIDQPAADSATISGHSWADLDLDGEWDANEPGRYGVRLFLDRDNNGAFDPETEPSAFTGEDGKFVFANLAPGTYTVREVEQGNRGIRMQTFPDTTPQAVTVVAGDVVAGSFGQAESPNLGVFEYGAFVRPADQFLDRLDVYQSNNPGNPLIDQTLSSLRAWQSFQVSNTTGASFGITAIDDSMIGGGGAALLSVRQVAADGSLVTPQLPITVADGESVEFFVFYDPAIRTGDTVTQQFPDWLNGNSTPHAFAASDRLVVETDAELSFAIQLVGGSTFDSDVSYDGSVDQSDLGLLDDLLLLEAVIGEGQSPRFDPTMDVNTRCPNGAGQVVGICGFAIGGTPEREIGLGDFGPLNVEFGRDVASALAAAESAQGEQASPDAIDQLFFAIGKNADNHGR